MLNGQRTKAPSRAELFFQELIAEPSTAFAKLFGLAVEKADENQWREFKEAKFIDDPLPPASEDGGKKCRDEKKRRDDSVKNLWSENLSAFANTGGGILIWGIKTKDRFADEPSLAGDAQRLADRLITLQNDAVDPPVTGVDVQAVTEEGSKAGFVVCYIPESAFSPHRSLWAEYEYYMRTGDGNRRVPTALLRRMFYPQFLPWLAPNVKAWLEIPTSEMGSAYHNRDGLYHLFLTVSITNRGNASAQEVCIQLESETPCDLNEGMLRESLWARITDGGAWLYYAKITIHPDQTVPFLVSMTNRQGFQAPEDGKYFKLRFKIFAHNAPIMISEVTFTGAELKKTIDEKQPVIRDALPRSQT
ncbi:MAG: ATP-binding protein [Verrucomicrobiaceae bacterium]|nr:ATP-binding protein [Verrucomicrobiaceae bacterium]